MDEEHALLAAVVAHPDDDTPRLVYADWLQEHDQPERAEYIRLSIQLANLRYGEPDFEARERQLLDQRRPLIERHYRKWEGDFTVRLPTGRNATFVFRRGFVAEVHCSVKCFLDCAEWLFASAPVRWFWPKSLSATTAQRLTASPWVGRLTGFRIIDPAHALALVEGTPLRVKALNFSQKFLFAGQTNTRGGWADVAQRIAAGHSGLKTIEWIDLESCGIGDAGGHALAHSPGLNSVVLNLLGNGLSDPVRWALRKRYGARVWLDPADRNGFPRG